jgi:uroporphyrinogen-III synthase
LGSDEPEVLGACYGGILRIEGVRAIPWITRFLPAGDDAAGEAALAIAATHSAEGFHALQDALEKTRDPWFRSVLLSAIALTRQDAAMDFLLNVVSTETRDAEGALEAIVRAMPSEETLLRLEKQAAGKPRLVRHLATLRKPSR